MKATILVFLLFFLKCFLVQAHAQNLVKNPGLEILKDGVVNFRKVSGTPDIASKYDNVVQYPPYYNSYQANLPTRSVSNIRFGEVCLCQWFSETSSELTQVELRRPLKKNREYVISLYTIKASIREPAVREITVYLTRKRLPATRKVYGFSEHELTGHTIPYLSLKSSASPVLNSMEEWVKVSGVYKAKGGERFLTIGNFIGANKKELEAMNPEEADTVKNYIVKGTYYCYDNISVLPIEEAITKEGQLTTSATVKPTFAVGSIITLSDVNFTTGSHEILPVAYPILDSLAAFMQAEPEAVVHIRGHTDDVGTESGNQQLSIRRAQAVKEYLAGRGIAPARMVYTGYGENKPKVPNDSDENRALNRRVEIEINRR